MSYNYNRLNLAEIAIRHEAGESIVGICQDLGIPSPKHLRRLLRQAGYRVRGRREAQRVRREQELFRGHKTLTARIVQLRTGIVLLETNTLLEAVRRARPFSINGAIGIYVDDSLRFLCYEETLYIKSGLPV